MDGSKQKDDEDVVLAVVGSDKDGDEDVVLAVVRCEQDDDEDEVVVVGSEQDDDENVVLALVGSEQDDENEVIVVGSEQDHEDVVVAVVTTASTSSSSRSLPTTGTTSSVFRLLRRRSNARNGSYTPNLTGEKHTISTFVDQNPFDSILANAEKSLFQTSLPLYALAFQAAWSVFLWFCRITSHLCEDKRWLMYSLT